MFSIIRGTPSKDEDGTNGAGGVNDAQVPGQLSQVTTPNDEYELVIRAQHRDPEALRTLYERYKTRIWHYLTNMLNDREVSQELTQDTFMEAWRSIGKLRTPAAFSSWLYQIATNKARNVKKRANRVLMVSLEDYNYQRPLSIDGPEEQLVEQELLRLALAQVSKTYRPCLILYCVEGLPQRQIANLLGIKESSVSKYVSRGTEQLRQIYTQLLYEEPTNQSKRRVR